MIELDPGFVPGSASGSAERVLAALKRKLGAVEISTGNPRFQELLEKQANGGLLFDERDELNALMWAATESVPE